MDIEKFECLQKAIETLMQMGEKELAWQVRIAQDSLRRW